MTPRPFAARRRRPAHATFEVLTSLLAATGPAFADLSNTGNGGIGGLGSTGGTHTSVCGPGDYGYLQRVKWYDTPFVRPAFFTKTGKSGRNVAGDWHIGGSNYQTCDSGVAVWRFYGYGEGTVGGTKPSS